jgi:hypothetical protein
LKQIVGEQSTAITSVQFTPDGTGIVFGTLDGRVVFSGVDTADVILEWAENNRYIPELTQSQCEQYGLAIDTCNT